MEPSRTDPQPPPAPGAKNSPPSSILLVEDDLLSQRLVSMTFTRAGHEVLIADSVSKGLELLKHNPLLDLVVIDNQLGIENGWSLMAEIRKWAHFEDLPIIAYTGSRDREVVLRYVQLGVQAFHLKPYRAEILLGELDRAHATGRRNRLWEWPPENACRRLKVTPEQYSGLLNSGAGQLEQDCRTIRRLMFSTDDTRLGMAFRSIAQQLPQLGINVVLKLVAQGEKELRAGDYAACSETLSVIDAVAACLRKRALAKFSMGDSVVSDLTASSPTPPAETEPAAIDLGDAGAPAYVRAILARPIGSLAAHVGPASDAPTFTDGKLTSVSEPWAQTEATACWYATVSWLDRAEQLTPDELGETLTATRGFDAIAETILVRTGVVAASRTGRVDWPAVVNKLGVTKSAVLAAAGRLCAVSAAGPLPLTALRQHTVMMVFLGFELGRLLRLTHPQKVAAAALARNLGVWTIAQADPVTTALALARGQHLKNDREAQRERLGLTFAEAGAQWLAAAGGDPLYQDAAAGRSTSAGSEATTSVVDLVEQFSHAALSGEATALEVLGKALAVPQHPVWEAFRRHGVTLPSDPAAVVELVLPLARSAAWIAREISRLRPEA